MTNQSQSKAHTLQASTSHNPDIDLSKVKQDSKRFELLAILDNPDACHIDRLDLARFLLGTAGYDVDAVCNIIHVLNHWSDYSVNMTYNQVMSVSRWLNRNHNHISNKVGKGFGENRSLEGFPHLSEYWIAKSNKREQKNKEKFKNNWDEYKKHKLSSHNLGWYGVFVDSDTCFSCGKSIVGWFNLHVHHLSYNPNKTCFIHALCHNHSFCINEKTRRDDNFDSVHKQDPVFCQIMSTYATCYYKKCDSCPLANSVFVENRRFCEVIPVKCSECPDSCRGGK